MDEIREEFEEYVDELDSMLKAGSLAGTDGEIARDQANELVSEYRSKLQAEELPSRGRDLLNDFKEKIRRL